MSLLQLFAGNGTRRKTDEQWTKLQQQLSTTQRELAAAKGLIAELTEQRDQARRNDIRHHHLWQSADREVRRLGFLLGANAQLPATQVPAPVDNGCRDTPRANADTQPVDVRDLRAAMGENDTVTLPAITPVAPVAPLDDTQMLVTWGAKVRAKAEADTQQIRLPQIPDRPPTADPVEAALNTPAPPPGAGASEISMAAELAAVTKVHATVTAN